jgi:hypothetical protein
MEAYEKGSAMSRDIGIMAFHAPLLKITEFETAFLSSILPVMTTGRAY